MADSTGTTANVSGTGNRSRSPMATVDRGDMRAHRTVALLGCLMLGSCLEIEQTVTLAADGSGTQVVHMTVRESLLNDLARRQPAARLGAGGDPSAVFDEERVRRELTEAGLELTGHVVERGEGVRTVDMVASFAAFDELRKSPLCGSAAEWVIGAGPRKGTAKLTLYPQGKEAWQQARRKAEQMDDELDPVLLQFFRKQRARLAGLDVVVRFRLPGDVYLWTRNMERTGPREVTARVTAAQIKTPEDLVRRLAPRFEVIFDARGTTLPK